MTANQFFQLEAKLAPLYARLQQAAADKDGAEVLALGGQIAAQDAHYRDVSAWMEEARGRLRCQPPEPNPARKPHRLLQKQFVLALAGIMAVAGSMIGCAARPSSIKADRVAAEATQNAMRAMATQTSDALKRNQPATAAAVAAQQTAQAAAAAATATLQAINANLKTCSQVRFAIIDPPNGAALQVREVTSTIPAVVTLTWQVKNETQVPSCEWKTNGQEKGIQLYAMDLDTYESTPVFLRWLEGDTYYVSLRTRQLKAGNYILKWKLLKPDGAGLGGQELVAKISIVSPALATLTAPASTPCRIEVYQCNCRNECGPSQCTTVCDTCVREMCGP